MNGPSCGWCYGNENITALQEEFKNEFDFELLVGGMWLGQNAPEGGDNPSYPYKTMLCDGCYHRSSGR